MCMVIESIIHDPNSALLFNIFVFIFGLCFGSFLNVCIYRIPLGESIVVNSSHCTVCGKKIKCFENIPVISWLFLRGKCSRCSERISVIYPIVEIITAIIVLLLWLKSKELSSTLAWFLVYINLTLLFIPAFFIDIKHRIIPNKLTYSVILISFVLSFIFPELMSTGNRFKALLFSVEGFLTAGFCLGLFSFVGKLICRTTILGWGDVKYIAALGAAFGIYSHAWIAILIISAWLGAICGLICIIVKKKKWSASLPFGPFLVIGSYLWIFLGEHIEMLYFELLQKYFL